MASFVVNLKPKFEYNAVVSAVSSSRKWSTHGWGYFLGSRTRKDRWSNNIIELGSSPIAKPLQFAVTGKRVLNKYCFSASGEQWKRRKMLVTSVFAENRKASWKQLSCTYSHSSNMLLISSLSTNILTLFTKFELSLFSKLKLSRSL